MEEEISSIQYQNKVVTICNYRYMSLSRWRLLKSSKQEINIIKRNGMCCGASLLIYVFKRTICSSAM